jgi:xanthosine utilization system XapX-like protein
MPSRPRPAPPLARALTLGLALALGVFVVEDAIHSVHHLLAEPDEMAACAVAAALGHVAGTVVETVTAEQPLEPCLERPADLDPGDPRIQFLRPDQGRAPPHSA